jgi:hypothetical protein
MGETPDGFVRYEVANTSSRSIAQPLGRRQAAKALPATCGLIGPLAVLLAALPRKLQRGFRTAVYR